MSRYTDVDAIIEDLRYDIELDARTLDDLDFADAKERELVQLDKDIKQNAITILEQSPSADVIKRKGLIYFLRGIVADLNKEMDECLERKEFMSRFYLKAKRTMVEHLISIFEEADDAQVH